MWIVSRFFIRMSLNVVDRPLVWSLLSVSHLRVKVAKGSTGLFSVRWTRAVDIFRNRRNTIDASWVFVQLVFVCCRTVTCVLAHKGTDYFKTSALPLSQPKCAIVKRHLGGYASKSVPPPIRGSYRYLLKHYRLGVYEVASSSRVGRGDSYGPVPDRLRGG